MDSPRNRLQVVSRQDSITVGQRTREFLQAVQSSMNPGYDQYLLALAEQVLLRNGAVDLEAVQALRTYRKINSPRHLRSIR